MRLGLCFGRAAVVRWPWARAWAPACSGRFGTTSCYSICRPTRSNLAAAGRERASTAHAISIICPDQARGRAALATSALRHGDQAAAFIAERGICRRASGFFSWLRRAEWIPSTRRRPPWRCRSAARCIAMTALCGRRGAAWRGCKDAAIKRGMSLLYGGRHGRPDVPAGRRRRPTPSAAGSRRVKRRRDGDEPRAGAHPERRAHSSPWKIFAH